MSDQVQVGQVFNEKGGVNATPIPVGARVRYTRECTGEAYECVVKQYGNRKILSGAWNGDAGPMEILSLPGEPTPDATIADLRAKLNADAATLQGKDDAIAELRGHIEDIAGALGLHPDTHPSELVAQIGSVRSEARNYPALQLERDDLRERLRRAEEVIETISKAALAAKE